MSRRCQLQIPFHLSLDRPKPEALSAVNLTRSTRILKISIDFPHMLLEWVLREEIMMVAPQGQFPGLD
jgi:hypothetical protein